MTPGFREYAAYLISIGGWPRRKLGVFDARPGFEDEVALHLYRRKARVVLVGSREQEVLDRQLGIASAWRADGRAVAHG